MSSIRKYTSLESPSTDDLIECMINGNDYFNEAESLVANSKISGKHNDGLWVTDRADSCESILESYLIFINFMISKSKKLDFDYSPPKLHACTSMQRMVKMYCGKSHLKTLEINS